MKHQEIKEILPLYIDGGLDKDEEEMVKAHLTDCVECTELLNIYQGNYDFLNSTEDVEVDESFLTSLMERIRLEKIEQRVEERTRRQSISKQRATARGKTWLERLKEVFGLRLRVPVGALGVGLAVILLIIIVNPFRQIGYRESPAKDESYYDYGIQTEMLDQQSSPELNMARQPMLEKRGLVADTPQPGGTAQMAEEIERKIIHVADLRVEVKNIQAADSLIVSMIEDMEGFISNSRKWELGNQRQFSRYTLRIPADMFYQAISEIETLGKVKDRSAYGQDVTEEYIDVESRLKNLVLQEERYRDLLERAIVVEDILKIERELERVRSTIESLQGRLNYLNNRVGLSTINVELMEPEPITSPDSGFVNAVRQAVRRMVNTFYDMIVRVGVVIPYLFLFFVSYVIYRIFKRSKRR